MSFRNYEWGWSCTNPLQPFPSLHFLSLLEEVPKTFPSKDIKVLWGSIQFFRLSFIELPHECSNTAQKTSAYLVHLSRKLEIDFGGNGTSGAALQDETLRQSIANSHAMMSFRPCIGMLSKFRVTERFLSEEKQNQTQTSAFYTTQHLALLPQFQQFSLMLLSHLVTMLLLPSKLDRDPHTPSVL